MLVAIERRRRLPQELIDMVLYDLSTYHGNKRTLKTCSLTCRAWLPACRALLFQYVTFGSPKGILFFSNILRQSPCLARYVRTLELCTNSCNTPYSDEVSDALKTILESMDHLQYLGLSSASCDLIEFLGRLPRMESVSTVHFQLIHFDNIERYTRLFASLPNVEHVDMEMLHVQNPADQPIPLAVIAPKLRRLELCIGSAAGYAPLLSSALDYLKVEFFKSRDFGQFCAVFRESTAASSLTTLDLKAFSDDVTHPYEGLLRRCTVLRHFNGFFGSALCAVYVMESMSASATHVRLDIPQDNITLFRRLAAALDCKRLPLLEKAKLYIQRNGPFQEDFFLEDLPKVFPDLCARGILKIKVGNVRLEKSRIIITGSTTWWMHGGLHAS